MGLITRVMVAKGDIRCDQPFSLVLRFSSTSSIEGIGVARINLTSTRLVERKDHSDTHHTAHRVEDYANTIFLTDVSLVVAVSSVFQRRFTWMFEVQFMIGLSWYGCSCRLAVEVILMLAIIRFWMIVRSSWNIVRGRVSSVLCGKAEGILLTGNVSV